MFVRLDLGGEEWHFFDDSECVVMSDSRQLVVEKKDKMQTIK